MGVLEFLCDIRFHRSFILPPNPNTNRFKPLRVSYADYGASSSNAVVLFWSDIDYIVPLLVKTLVGEGAGGQTTREWTVHTFHAEVDGMVGDKGRLWYDECWSKFVVLTSSDDASSAESHEHVSLEYRSEVVPESNHNFVMDPAYGASFKWLQNVREAFSQPRLEEVREDQPLTTLDNP
jgi:hypothetical protein